MLSLLAAGGAEAFSAFAPSLSAPKSLRLRQESVTMSSNDNPMSRRAAVVVTAGLLGSFLAPKESKAEGAFSLPALPYDYKSLEPYIDEETMKLHHDKHFNAYLTNLNKALEGKPAAKLTDIQKEAIKAGPAIRNNGGGYYNHALFFKEMGPAANSGKPSAALQKAIDASFGSMDKMKEEFNAAAAKRFGSGWAWLGVTPEGKLAITSTPNQDNPLMEGCEGQKMIPVLGLDVWEHAYYLKYQNRRPEYITNWWSVVNWEAVSNNYEKFAAKGIPVEVV
ncbi:hypothetical protein GUITHDRAFT_150004 [Guillardia theta CCMP2712]|uniref:superoxide dismutase n=1 Tax=Guillardia theta (strain CCMP2712) TaxID=905079 RepID=L1K0Q9_GUITC|nr:hypothetical protein GUITHDRAFT_150004 [Guillardia theta CCMP2712]EKX54416.1 hypothetical protein GUITHDRAFT_150004 [Guillardia theta CCMP2712]|eukprot:XP_005841396.1 hypothetical protein GUITHDRAFT_150004 [Guillardia theta CCMP2712]